MHLLAPRRLNINDGIEPEQYHLWYKKIDNAIAFVKQTGQSCYMAKINLKKAFRLCLVRREDWDLLEVYWDGQYYVGKRLLFGRRSSPALFNQVADTFEWILVNECHINSVLN